MLKQNKFPVSNGDTLVWEGEGMPVFGAPWQKGDLYLHMTVSAPDDLIEAGVCVCVCACVCACVRACACMCACEDCADTSTLNPTPYTLYVYIGTYSCVCVRMCV